MGESVSIWLSNALVILSICCVIVGVPIGIWRFTKATVRDATTEHDRQFTAIWAKVDGLAADKATLELTLVKEYATQAALRESEARSERIFRDSERRLTEHLVRIETKLDARAPSPRAE